MKKKTKKRKTGKRKHTPAFKKHALKFLKRNHIIVAIAVCLFVFLAGSTLLIPITHENILSNKIFAWTFLYRPPKPKPVVKIVATPTPLSTTDQIIAYIRKKFGRNANHALCIAFHESGYNPLAIHFEYNGSIDRGVFQINSSHNFSADVLFDWKQNVDIAYAISRRGIEWRDWTTNIFCN